MPPRSTAAAFCDGPAPACPRAPTRRPRARPGGGRPPRSLLGGGSRRGTSTPTRPTCSSTLARRRRRRAVVERARVGGRRRAPAPRRLPLPPAARPRGRAVSPTPATARALAIGAPLFNATPPDAAAARLPPARTPVPARVARMQPAARRRCVASQAERGGGGAAKAEEKRSRRLPRPQTRAHAPPIAVALYTAAKQQTTPRNYKRALCKAVSRALDTRAPPHTSHVASLRGDEAALMRPRGVRGRIAHRYGRAAAPPPPLASSCVKPSSAYAAPKTLRDASGRQRGAPHLQRVVVTRRLKRLGHRARDVDADLVQRR